MANNKSTQHRLGKIRSPRVQITYDVEVGDAPTQKELPFVVGVIADLAPGSAQAKGRLRDRTFSSVDAESFDSVMASLAPTLTLKVKNHLSGDGGMMNVSLHFDKLASFTPDAIASSVPQLSKLLAARARLNDLLAKLEGNETLNDLLYQIVSAPQLQARIGEEARLRGPTSE
ncbi:type VI secretion system contractile sheath small subunit [Caballeronia zhejiangensis]|uniref:type VI secretion system contractile sheath small subunit n=1 Tax=Caballeronia zhejiangensis TaxID=871203 RepID=UPI00158874C5|nr:type VI secretion system contractile sheath small subunit [Caballeronia zhejiangensis]